MELHAPTLNVRQHLADAAHHWKGRNVRPVFIGLHATAGKNSEAFLTETRGSEASASFLVPKEGPAIRLVRDEDAPWTNGRSTVYVRPGGGLNPNHGVLSIEVENMNDGRDPYTVYQYDATARIVVGWWAKYGYLPVIKHWLIQSNKVDPHGWDDRLFSAHLFALVKEHTY